MAAGDLIHANLADLTTDLAYQAETGGYLLGDGSPWSVMEVDGVGDIATSVPRVARDMADGDITGVATNQSGAVTITARCHTGAPDTMELAIAAVRAAWSVASPSVADVLELHLLVPGRGHIYVVGHPAQMAAKRVFPAGGDAVVVCTFSKSSPTETTVAP